VRRRHGNLSAAWQARLSSTWLVVNENPDELAWNGMDPRLRLAAVPNLDGLIAVRPPAEPVPAPVPVTVYPAALKSSASFYRAIAASAATDWRDGERLYIRLIREAPQRALTTPRFELMAHPILRIARLKYGDGSVEQREVLRFLNAQCIKQGFQSEEDYFTSDLALAQWARDARQWAINMLEVEPEVYEGLFNEAGEKALDRTRAFYHQHLGSDPAHVDSLDATAALMKWANQRRGFEFSQYRAQLWEFVVEIVDAALWLGLLFRSGLP
jgi:hypothetical protein